MIIRRKKTTTALPQSESNILDNLLEKDFDVAGLQQPVVEEEKEEIQIFDVDNFDFLQNQINHNLLIFQLNYIFYNVFVRFY